jgi:histidine phosphotransferase ChpT
MLPAPEMRVFALLVGRLCHELIGPAGAVENGVELIGDGDQDFGTEALALVADSARRMTARLQFYRFAYGLAGEDWAGAPPGELAGRYFASEKIACDYGGAVRALSPATQKLACNLLLVGAAALPRGGRLALDVMAGELSLEAAGDGVALAPEETDALTLRTSPGALTPRTVQHYFAGLLAQAQGARLAVLASATNLRIRFETAAR